MAKLDSLPLEILIEILDYNTLAQNRCPTPLHPLNAVASTNKQLYAVVEEYSRGMLKQHANYTPPKFSKIFSCRKKWLGETCQFCKRKSTRRAILYPGLTCCRLCDKQYFPKITMTQAHKAYNLSKLDLFTPNALHPKLPPLTTGLYTVMGGAATMILERDVRARKAHIRALLGPKGNTDDMHRRPAAHDRIISHLGLYYCPTRSGWRRAPVLSPAAMDKAVKSMKTEEGRREYVKRALNKEWAAMSVGSGSPSSPVVVIEQDAFLERTMDPPLFCGGSKDAPLELDG